MLGQDRNHHGGVFGTLGFVDGDRVGVDEFVQFREVVGDLPAVEGNQHLLPLHVDANDPADVAVVDLLVIVVRNLHHLVADPVEPPHPAHPLVAWVQRLLEFDVEVLASDDPPVHRREDLDIVEGIETEPLRDPFLDHGDDELQHPLGVLLFDEVEIVEFFPGVVEMGHLPLVDPVGVDDDRALPGLAKDLVEFDNGDGLRSDDVPKNIPRPDRGELVDVPHEDKGRPGGNGLEQVVHQQGVDHRGLVDDQKVAIEG